MRISLQLVVVFAFASSLTGAEPHPKFVEWDKNKDGRLERSELPPGIRGNFAAADVDGDGFISAEEDSAFRNRGRKKPAKPLSNVVRKRSSPRLPEGTIVEQNIAYVDNGHERQKLDLYLPAEGENLPLVIWVHGGAWRAGSKENCPALSLVAKGFAVASINYRLSQHAIFPAQINDCKSAVRWLRLHAKEYRIDAKRFGVWGASAGGHLVALMGTSGDVVELETKGANPKISSRVQAVCDYFGPTNFLLMNQQAGESGRIDHDAVDSPESSLIGGAIQQNKDKVARANPITYISADDPPFLIVHGDQDPLVNIRQSRIFHDALQKAKVDSRLHEVVGAGHGRFSDPKIAEMVHDFFAKCLAP